MLKTSMQAPSTPADELQRAWGYIDRIYCISLDHREDRQQQAKEQFAKVGLTDRVEFMIGQKDPTNAERGNFIAQMKCLQAGVDAGASTICIFEDDIIFDRFSVRQLTRAVEFMQTTCDWNIFFFGCFVKASRRTKHPSVIHVRFRSTTHAYVITREFALKLLAIPWPGRCLDDLICSLKDPGMYAMYPAFGFQSNSRTDNDKQIRLDQFRRALGGMRFLQKWNEFSTLNFSRLIAIHAVILLMMVAGAFILHFRYGWNR